MIEEILNSNEGKTLEFKENLQSMQGVIKTVIAFANTAGGMIVVGVENGTKRVVGVSDPLTEEERLANVIYDSIWPQIMTDINIQSYRTKDLIIINVPHSVGPCHLKAVGMEKGTYVRLGSTNRLVDEETLHALKNIAKNIYYDELPAVHKKYSDLDWEVIKELFNRVKKKITPTSARSLGLLTDHENKEVPSLGAVILFGTNRLKLFPEAIIRCSRFIGIDRDEALDRADIDIYLPLALEEAIKFVQRNTSVRSEIKRLERKDIPQYPPRAIREAITNAIVHADYAMKGVFISIAIFDDRIEITNPGGLPFGFTMEKALAGSSRIRNRVIARVFYNLKWIEQWGRGLGRIIKECALLGLETPTFEEENNQFKVTLFARKKQEVTLEAWQKELITFLKKKEKITTKEAALLWKVTRRTARLRLIKLTDTGIIQKTGTSLRDPQSEYVLGDKL